MIVTSIDISGGKVVQLRNGMERVLERSDPLQLIKDFSLYGETAIVDIDAAKGNGSNRELVVSLLREGICRVGGGIRTVEEARYFIDMGADKVILGSAIFERTPCPDGVSYKVNADFLEKLAGAVGKNNIILALDVLGETIVAGGWLVDTGMRIFDVLSELDSFASGFLVTKVEREGLMQGTDMEFYRKLRGLTKSRITAAGGISEPAEVAELAELGIDAQLGMAVYTGKLDLAEAFCASLNWKTKLLPVLAQDTDGTALMLGYADRMAVLESCRRRKLCFYSRSRQQFWMKGETSGNTLGLLRLGADCDGDTILATVVPSGPVCHTGMDTCFGNSKFTLEKLQTIICERFANPRPGSYTATLDDKLVREKIMEEALEVCEAATKAEVIWEAADVLYFLLVLMTKEGVSLSEVLAELQRRKRSSR